MRRKYNIDSHHGFASHSLCGREDFFHDGVDVLLRLVGVVDIYIPTTTAALQFLTIPKMYSNRQVYYSSFIQMLGINHASSTGSHLLHTATTIKGYSGSGTELVRGEIPMPKESVYFFRRNDMQQGII